MAELSKRAANDRVENLKARLKGMSTKARDEGKALLSTAVSIGAGAVLGAVDEYSVNRNGRPALLGTLDNTLVVGVLSTGGAIMGLGGEGMRRALRDVGNTSFGIYGYKMVFQAMVDRRRAAATREGSEEAAAAEGGGGGRAGDVRG